MDALERYPDIVAAITERHWDILGHGLSNTRFIYDYSEGTERAYYREMLDKVEALTGVRMKGMGGPGPQAGTENTPDLLAEAGFLYQGDWYMDDQPFPLRVRSGKLIALPYPADMMNDVSAFASFEADEYCEAVKGQFDRLYRRGRPRAHARDPSGADRPTAAYPLSRSYPRLHHVKTRRMANDRRRDRRLLHSRIITTALERLNRLREEVAR